MKNFKNFGITFAVSIVILGIVALFACGYVADTVADIFNKHGKDLEEILSNAVTDSAATPTDPEDERFTRELNGTSFTWLVVVSDKRTDVYNDYFPSKKDIEASTEAGVLGKEYRLEEAAAIAVVRADVTKREYAVLTIPSITKVETGSGDHTLGEVYAIYGIDYLKNKIDSMTGLTTDYYTVMNSTELDALAGTVGAIELEIPKKIFFNGKEYISEPAKDTTAADTTIAQADKETGAQTEAVTVTEELDAAPSQKISKKLQAAILYKDWSDGVEQEMTILNSFIRGVLSNISSYSDKSLQSAFTGLKSKIKETNITDAAITERGEVIRAYSWLAKQNIVYPGRMSSTSGDGKIYYLPDITRAMEALYNYR